MITRENIKTWREWQLLMTPVYKSNDDKDKTKRIEKSIASYIKSQQPKDAKDKSRKRKSKEITRNAA